MSTCHLIPLQLQPIQFQHLGIQTDHNSTPYNFIPYEDHAFGFDLSTASVNMEGFADVIQFK